ncbi:MAG: DoxX family membrane protein [Candidatus Paceibacterota bacterium]
MLSIFPNLLTYGLAGPTLLRIVAGLIIIYSGYQLYRSLSAPKSILARIIALLEVLGGIFLVIGLFTQPVALVLILILLIQALKSKTPRWAGAIVYNKRVYLLLIVILLSLLVSGPGFLAFDLPL